MASLITLRLYNEDGTPKTGSIPKLSAILQKNKTTVLNGVNMEEVGNGFYQYEFTNYKKGNLYFFSVDGEEYDGINRFDSYGNKNTWGKDNSVFIDTDAIAQNIWDAKEKDMKKGTIGRHVFDLKNISFDDLTSKLEIHTNNILLKSDELLLSLSGIITGIKIPKQLNVIDVIKPIENIINTSIKEYADRMKMELEEIEERLEENMPSDEGYDDSDLKLEIGKIYTGISEIKGKIDDIGKLEMKLDNGEQNTKNIGLLIQGVKDELSETNRKMSIVFTRLNKQ